MKTIYALLQQLIEASQLKRGYGLVPVSAGNRKMPVKQVIKLK